MNAHYISSGHLVYGAAGTLRAVPFDLARLAVIGTPVPVVPQVLTKNVGAVDFDVASNGVLVYVSGVWRGQAPQVLVWVDRQGQEQAVNLPAQPYAKLAVSPDGSRVALDVRGEQAGIWIGDLIRGTSARLTFGSITGVGTPTGDQYPVWDPDGRRVLFASTRAGVRNIFRQAADGTGTAERVIESQNPQNATAISPDAKRVVVQENGDILIVTMDQERRGEFLAQTPFTEENAEISPDGRWIAYESNESGRDEVYVQPFPDVNSGKWLISPGGGTRPLWAKKAREIFYISPSGSVMVVPFETMPTWKAGTPVKLFDWPIPAFVGRNYDVSVDGRRFLMLKTVDAPDLDALPASLVVVQHFDEELKRLVPTR
jgi:serine/threonine-protein kinase